MDGGKLCDRAAASWREGKLQEAQALYNQALAREPRMLKPCDALGAMHFESDDFIKALPFLRRAAGAAPTPTRLFNLAMAYKSQQRYEKAFAVLDEAAAMQEQAETYFKKGQIWMALLDHKSAVPCMEKAFALDKTHAHAAFDIGYCNLGCGNFEEAWKAYELRDMIPWLMDKNNFSGKRWQGEKIKGSLLLGFEQGIGDLVLFLRYASLARRKCAHLVVQAPENVRPLAAAAPGVDDTVVAGVPAEGFDFHLPFASLPGILGVDPRSHPLPTPYFDLPSEKLEKAEAWLASLPGTAPRIGIVWAGSPGYIRDDMRSLQFKEALPILEAPGACFVSLQHGELGDECFTSGVAGLVRDARPMMGDFLETAALIAGLDLLICCDTAVTNIAGALGVPVWVLTERRADWRWYSEGGKAPIWYPSARIFRQHRSGVWTQAVAEVRDALQARLRR